MYQRKTWCRTFLRWCLREGLIDYNPAEHLAEPDSPLRTYRRTYGKVQARNPGRWLNRDQAYGQLVGACKDGSVTGLRDEIIIRLGLLGMRRAEIAALNLSHVAHLPTITWTGKGRKPRQATAGTALCAAITTYLAVYPHPHPDAPLIVPQVMGAARHGAPNRLDWHHRISDRRVAYAIQDRAAAAGLGHVAPPTIYADQPPASSTTPPPPREPTTSTCSTSRRSWATPIPPQPCAATWTP